MIKLERWIPQTTDIDVLKFLMHQEVQAIMLQKVYVHGDFSFLDLMFSRLPKIIVDIITRGSSLPDSS